MRPEGGGAHEFDATVRTALELKMKPRRFVTCTAYTPASANDTFVRTKDEFVAPGKFVAFNTHW
jgi:hypothetical protein